MTVTYLSVYFQLLTGIIPLFISLRRVYLHPSLLLFLAFSVLSTIVLLITSYNGINNHVFHNFYLLISFLLLSKFYYDIGQTMLKAVIIFSTLILFTVSTFEFFDYYFLPNSFKIINLSYITWSIFFFIQSLEKDKVGKHNSNDYHIINTSIFLYNTSSFILIFYIMNLMNNNLWYIHNFIEGSSKLLIAYAFWKLPKTSHY